MSGTIGEENWEQAGAGLAITAIGTARVPIDEMPAFRKTFRPPDGPRITPAMVKHADDQTVLGLAAVLRAIADSRLDLPGLVHWGVIAAPRFLGRQCFAASGSRFQQKRASSVSPLIIPNASLHSMSGTISLAIGARGTNFGVGGGNGYLGEALLAGLVTLQAQDPGLSGLWIVATQWDPEPIPEPDGTTTTPAVGYGVALGVVARTAVDGLGTMRLIRHERGGEDGTVVDLMNHIEATRMTMIPKPWRCHLPGLGMVELALESAVTCGLVSRAG